MSYDAPYERKPATSLRHPAIAAQSVPFGIRTWCGILALFGSAVLVPRIGPNGAIVDPILLAIIFFGVRSLARRQDSPARVLLRASVPWLWLIALGTVVSLFSAGLAGWALQQIAIGVFSFTLFFAACQVFYDERAHLAAFRTTVLITVLFVVATLAFGLDVTTRQQGTFYHPNYAAHFLASALIVTWPRFPTARQKALMALALVGMLFTASFGGMLMLLAAGAYELVRYVRWRPALAAAVLAATIVSGWFVIYLQWQPDLEFAPTRVFSTARFERSQTSRFDTWQTVLASVRSEPLGIGPGGVEAADLTSGGPPEAHNAYISYLVERGPISLLGLIGLGVALWRRGEPGGAARRFIIAIAASNAVRETLHYRHMWLLLALAFAWEAADRLQRSYSDHRRLHEDTGSF
jgi:hypothetical protein